MPGHRAWHPFLKCVKCTEPGALLPLPCAPYYFPSSARPLGTKNNLALLFLLTLFPIFTLLTLKIDLINRCVVHDDFRPLRLAHTILRISFYFYTMCFIAKGILCSLSTPRAISLEKFPPKNFPRKRKLPEKVYYVILFIALKLQTTRFIDY